MSIIVYIRNYSLGRNSFRTAIVTLTPEQEALLHKSSSESYCEGYILANREVDLRGEEIEEK